MKRCVIVGGADINNYEYIRGGLKDGDFIVYCDSGLKHMQKLGVKPNLIVGDFDSFEDPRLDVETIVLPCEKDDTDTVYGVREGIKRGFEDFLIIGGVGARLDHTLGNLYILSMLRSLGKKGRIIDDYSEMELLTDEIGSIDDSFSYFSLINITGTAKGVTIKNAKYPLENAEISCDYQYGISNEVIPGKTAEVSLKEGGLLLIKVF